MPVSSIAIRVSVIFAAVVLGMSIFPGPVHAVSRLATCGQDPPRYPRSTALPYAQQRYAPERLEQLATGAGIRVAVLDSGVDVSHPQLRGRVAAGKDFLHGKGNAQQDCVGHGTGVASIIAAAPARGSGVLFHGLAPQATIVPVRISELQEGPNGELVGAKVDGKQVAAAIDWAVHPKRGNADVINLSVVMTENHGSVRRAIEDAIEAGVVVVAAAGNDGRQDANPTPYPAAYPGVIGVGAIGPEGLRQDYSQRGPYVDVVAPGGQVTVAARRSGHRQAHGTSFATPFVAATAALIRQRFPELTVDQVAQRIIATSDPAPGGRRSDSYGHGVLNPYRALTEALSSAPRRPPVALPKRGQDPSVAAAQWRRAKTRTGALIFAGIGVGLATVIVLVAVIVPRGRRRGWRPPLPG